MIRMGSGVRIMKEYKAKVINLGNNETKVILFDGDKIAAVHDIKVGSQFGWMTMSACYAGAELGDPIEENKISADDIKAFKIPTDNITAFTDSEIDEVTVAGKDYKIGKGVNIYDLARQRDLNKLAKQLADQMKALEDCKIGNLSTTLNPNINIESVNELTKRVETLEEWVRLLGKDKLEYESHTTRRT